MSEASVPDQSERNSDEFFELANTHLQNAELSDPVDHWYRLGQHNAYRDPALEWRGPLAFGRAYGAVPCIDHDPGSGWGSNGDQRVSLHIEAGAEAGLLYVYDPTWDEYAVLGTDVPLAAVQDEFARASISVITWLLRAS